MMDKIAALLQGKKTYIVLIFGALVAVVGHFFGPISAGPVQIPLVDTGAMWTAIWAALSGIFMRKGITAEVQKIAP